MYRDDFYKHRKQQTQQSAALVAGFVMDTFPELSSVVDFGCGVGVWLAEFRRLGVQRILGMDGEWVNQDLLEIEREAFRPTSLEQPVDIGAKFDLAISLEVAEHLPESAARVFVQSLTKASDLVLFSAAIPAQPGTNHVNAKWQSYWARMFADNGYAAFDVLRPRFWNDARIRYFYRQNMLMYAKKDNSDVIKALCRLPNWHNEHAGVTDLVHPDLLEFILRKQSSVGASWKLFRENLKDHVAHLLKGG